MCGIIGYTGFRQACNVLVEGLRRLEYRGYDSAGILIEDQGKFTTIKREADWTACAKRSSLSGNRRGCGMGHTKVGQHRRPSPKITPHGTAGHVRSQRIIEIYNKLKKLLGIKDMISSPRRTPK
jgi:glucosamine--fructose-6-phosphate aminotransferase (isomerizing)